MEQEEDLITRRLELFLRWPMMTYTDKKLVYLHKNMLKNTELFSLSIKNPEPLIDDFYIKDGGLIISENDTVIRIPLILEVAEVELEVAVRVVIHVRNAVIAIGVPCY